MMARLGHLVRRFVTSVRGRTPSEFDRQWAEGFLSPGERGLWDRMSPVDQAHSVDVARRVSAGLPDIDDVVIVAALMHDVGKIEADAGVTLRVLATLVGPLLSRSRLEAWPRLAAHVHYPEIGASLLVEVGSDPLVCTWAGEHHDAPGRSSLDPAVAAGLRRADDAAS
jgi:hypothetical protein